MNINCLGQKTSGQIKRTKESACYIWTNMSGSDKCVIFGGKKVLSQINGTEEPASADVLILVCCILKRIETVGKQKQHPKGIETRLRGMVEGEGIWRWIKILMHPCCL